MTDTDTTQHQEDVAESIPQRSKYVMAAVVILFVFFATYSIALARSGSSDAGLSSSVGGSDCVDDAACGTVPLDEQSGSTCCGEESVAIEGVAVLEQDVQRIFVDVSAGFFDPNIIRVSAGVPVEITFGEGSGCMAEVMFKDFGVFESLASGGTVVNLPALEPGEYEFSCGMEMVFASVVAE